MKKTFRSPDSEKGRLSLITSVIGASACPYVHSLVTQTLLRPEVVVILLSFTHDHAFHVDGVRRFGKDLVNSYNTRYTFIDGLVDLFFDGKNLDASKHFIPQMPDMTNISVRITNKIETIKETIPASDICLIVQNPDFLIAGAGTVAFQLVQEILSWHSLVTSTTVIVHADSALMTHYETRLQKEHSAFVLTLAHQAESVFSLRKLDTGIAKEVSGLMRVTCTADGPTRRSESGSIKEVELLYLVKENSMQIFNRWEMKS